LRGDYADPNFQSSNSLAVRIPKELAFDSDAQEVEIERKGKTLLIRHVGNKTLTGIGDIFKMFSPRFRDRWTRVPRAKRGQRDAK
jgi:antitoxin VapB